MNIQYIKKGFKLRAILTALFLSIILFKNTADAKQKNYNFKIKTFSENTKEERTFLTTGSKLFELPRTYAGWKCTAKSHVDETNILAITCTKNILDEIQFNGGCGTNPYQIGSVGSIWLSNEKHAYRISVECDEN